MRVHLPPRRWLRNSAWRLLLPSSRSRSLALRRRSASVSPYDPGDWPSPQTDFFCFDEYPPQRIVLTSPHVVHVLLNADLIGFKIAIERVVRCMAGCELDEYKYCWPQACSGALLPPGTYDISIPAQSAYPLPVGTQVDATILLEPVGSDYIDALKIMGGGSKGCCDCCN